MLKNYIKIGLKVLKRRPFYTFISLFGISFTLMVMMLEYTLYQNYAGNIDVMEKFGCVGVVNRTSLLNLKTQSNSTSHAGYFLYNKFAKKLKSAETMAVASHGASETFFNKGKKYSTKVIYTDAAFWNIFVFQFLQGRYFNEAEVEKAEKVAVLSENMCRKHFGSTDVLGKTIVIRDLNYTIIGIVKNVSSIRTEGYAQIYLPVTCNNDTKSEKDLLGGYNFYFMARSKSDLKTIENEWNVIVKSIDVKSYDRNFLTIESKMHHGWDKFLTFGETSISWLIGLVAFLFMLLPALNLVSINITRILERSSEIGIRKSFGASRKILVYQFLVENFILTFFGGLAGLILTYIAIYLINNGLVADATDLVTDYTVFIFGLLTVFVFNILSGTYPALKMSKMNIINALKEDNQ